MKKKQNKKHEKLVVFSAVGGMIIFLLFTQAVANYKMYSGFEGYELKEFTDKNILSTIRPELRENVLFFTINKPFQMTSESGLYYAGLYFNQMMGADVIVFIDGYYTKTVLCHELMHKYWEDIMSQEEKATFIKVAQRSKTLSLFEIKELYALMYERDYQRCYINETKNIY